MPRGPLEERNLFAQPLEPKEIEQLAKRAGGVENLVAPTRRGEVEVMNSAEIVDYLAGDPARVRRPIIDTGGKLFLGFNKQVQQQLGG